MASLSPRIFAACLAASRSPFRTRLSSSSANLPEFLIVFILTLLLVRGGNIGFSAGKLVSAAVTM